MEKAAAAELVSCRRAGELSAALRRLDFLEKPCLRKFCKNCRRHAYLALRLCGVLLNYMFVEAFLQLFRAHVVAQDKAHVFFYQDPDEISIVVAGIAAHKNPCAGEAFPELLNQPADVNQAERGAIRCARGILHKRRNAVDRHKDRQV